MSWRSHGRDNADMVVQLEKNGILTSSHAAAAMRQVDRAGFVTNGGKPYEDSPQLIGFNATISAPHMHGFCLSLLDAHLQPGKRVLDVGSGSGYLTAVMALMVGPSGRAVGVEHIPELAERSIKAIAESEAGSLMESGVLTIHVADGRKGFPSEAPYDAIHVGAAPPKMPEALIEQLKPGGRLVIPVGGTSQELEVVDKSLEGEVTRYSAMGVRYVPLTEVESQLAG